jgi:hypothetical protein
VKRACKNVMSTGRQAVDSRQKAFVIANHCHCKV